MVVLVVLMIRSPDTLNHTHFWKAYDMTNTKMYILYSIDVSVVRKPQKTTFSPISQQLK